MSLSSIVKALPEAVRNPVGLAMIGSFAFHGLMFAGVPLLPIASKAVKSERLVRLIELSPGERNRVPQAASSPMTLPPGPPSDLSALVLPPLSELPDLSKQPNLSASLPSANLPSPNSSLPSLGSPPQIDTGQPLPSGPPIAVPGQIGRPDIFPPPPNQNSLPPLPPPPMPDLADAPPIDFPDNTLPPDQVPPPEPGTSEELNEWINQAREISGNPELEYENRNIRADYPKEACKDRPQGLAIVAVLVTPNGGIDKVELKGDSGNKILNDAAVAAVRKHTFPPTGKYQAFLPSFNFKYSDEACSGAATTPSQSADPARDSQPIKTNIPYEYPEAACKERLQDTATAITQVNSKGVAEEPDLSPPTGKPILDKEVLAAVRRHKFPSTGRPQTYRSDFVFRYPNEACGVTPQPSSEGQDTPQPSAPRSAPKVLKTTPQSPKTNKPASRSPSDSKGGATQPAPKSSEESTPEETTDTEETEPQESPEDTEKPTTP